MNKIKKIILMFICFNMVLLAGCWSVNDIRQDVVLNSLNDGKGDENIFLFDYLNNINIKEAKGNTNPLNLPDPAYYASKYVFNYLGADVMPIMGYVEPRIYDENYKATIDQTFLDFSNSGCNLMINSYYGTGSDGQVLEMLDYADKYNLMFLIKYGGIASANNYETIEEAAERISLDLREYAKHPSFAGLHVVDEPGWYSWVSNNGDDSEVIWPIAHQAFNKVYNSKLFYINLLPIYSPAWAFTNGANGGSHESSVNYEYYYQTYIDNVKPKVFSYDYYPITGTFPQLKSQHFYQISLAKKYSELANIPYWSFIQVCDWTGGAARKISYSELSWQVNTALAFGGKGIQYFTYGTYSDNGLWLGAMVSFDGTVKNQTYYDVQKINKNITSIDHILLNCNNKGVIQYGLNPNGEVISPTQGRIYDYKRYKSSRGINHLIGCMEYYPTNNFYDEKMTNPPSEEVYYVLNNTINRAGDVEVEFDQFVAGEWYYNGTRQEFEGSKLSLPLNAGEAALIRLYA